MVVHVFVAYRGPLVEPILVITDAAVRDRIAGGPLPAIQVDCNQRLRATGCESRTLPPRTPTGL